MSVELSNLADKIESLQKEVGRGLTKMNNNIKSLSVKAVLTTLDSPSSLSTRTARWKATGEDLAQRTNIIVLGDAKSQLIVHDKG